MQQMQSLDTKAKQQQSPTSGQLPKTLVRRTSSKEKRLVRRSSSKKDKENGTNHSQSGHSGDNLASAAIATSIATESEFVDENQQRNKSLTYKPRI